jgi:hypothetical protein
MYLRREKEKNRYSSHVYTYIQTMHVGTILCQYVCRVVSSPTINRLFLARPQKWFVLLLSLFSSFFWHYVHWQFLFRFVYWYNCTCDVHIHIYLQYIYRQSYLSSVVEMIIINDHGSLVVCCWQYLFLNTYTHRDVYIHILQWEKEKSGITKLDVVNSRLGLLRRVFREKRRESWLI